ncbi:hypothetical protein V491_07754 [Pseudogymnoascus sp. VKM F-3775]|nr:hypothetical protein V491_07754 [Pseudogymnoascus sp. VKM F-3775]
MCRRPGEDGERTTLEDYLIARKFQPVVQERYEIDLTIAQMIQLRVDLKQANRFVGYTAYHALFGMAHRKADQI